MILLVFHHTKDAMVAEEILLPTIAVYMMSVPQSITAGCGFALRGKKEDLEIICSLLSHMEFDVYDIIQTPQTIYSKRFISH